jgi:hypothetical protein
MEACLGYTLTAPAQAALLIAIVVLILDHRSVADGNPSYSDSSALELTPPAVVMPSCQNL